MPKSLKALSLVAAAVLAACATQEPATPQAPVATGSGNVATSGSGAAVMSSADTGRIVAIPVAAPAGTASPAARAGYGIVEAVSLVYQAPRPSASAGGTAPAVPGPYRLHVRMDDGSVQEIVQDYRGFLVGDRVQITGDGRILRS